MKIARSVYWCAVVALSFGPSTANVAAQETQVLPTADETADSPPTMCRCAGESGSAAARIKQALGQPLRSTGLDFTDEPLENVLIFLQDEYDIPIQLDILALEDAGLTADEPLSANLQNISLKSALRLLLRQHQLTYLIRDEILCITTPDVADQELVTCVYDVRDLIGANKENKDIQALVDAIISCVAFDTWSARGGGEAEIRPLRPGLLVISQTQPVHDEIADLLGLIRETLN